MIGHIIIFEITRVLCQLLIILTKMCYQFLEELREHFSAYGDIESINVKTDPNTGRSRGFAFIVFAKAESLDKVLNFIFFYLLFLCCVICMQ